MKWFKICGPQVNKISPWQKKGRSVRTLTLPHGEPAHRLEEVLRMRYSYRVEEGTRSGIFSVLRTLRFPEVSKGPGGGSVLSPFPLNQNC